MSDPAVDAALRTLVSMVGREWNRGEALEAAAREALAPIRRLHSPHCGCSNDHVRMHIGPDCDPVCQDCGQLWPCDTAKLIYTTSELENR